MLNSVEIGGPFTPWQTNQSLGSVAIAQSRQTRRAKPGITGEAIVHLVSSR